MKTAASNAALRKQEDPLRAAAAKALSAEKAAQAEKEKARLAKRDFKAARRAFKQAKKAAKKAQKRSRQAQEELKACVDKAAKEKKRTGTLARPQDPRRSVEPTATAASKKKPLPPHNQPLSPATITATASSLSPPAPAPSEPAPSSPGSEAEKIRSS